MERLLGDLTRAQIQLRHKEDELIWDVDSSGNYTSKDGYIKLSADVIQRDPIWQWKKLWKIKSPPKTRIFMWCVLENKALTWDNL